MRKLIVAILCTFMSFNIYAKTYCVELELGGLIPVKSDTPDLGGLGKTGGVGLCFSSTHLIELTTHSQKTVLMGMGAKAHVGLSFRAEDNDASENSSLSHDKTSSAAGGFALLAGADLKMSGDARGLKRATEYGLNLNVGGYIGLTVGELERSRFAPVTYLKSLLFSDDKESEEDDTDSNEVQNISMCNSSEDIIIIAKEDAGFFEAVLEELRV